MDVDAGNVGGYEDLCRIREQKEPLLFPSLRNFPESLRPAMEANLHFKVSYTGFNLLHCCAPELSHAPLFRTRQLTN
jgi:hypothetical protein